ncbi:MAG: chemotaxis protein methyltransferase CheR, partial [Actinomycetota bacterium]|nr:chemotaxis protein methyltransferase CheR [Actinomycetota bacterium]
ACSTGQEPYSIAMSILDHPLITSDWQVDVTATDINEEILERARQAKFSQLEVNRGLPVSMLVRHFERAETDWRVVAPVRSMVRFKALNLAEPFDMPPMDVVFLRNVLIYFDSATKSEVLKRVRRVLRPDGYLLLGGAETTLGLDDGFDRVAVGTTTAYRPKGAGPAELPDKPVPAVAGPGVVGPRFPDGSAIAPNGPPKVGPNPAPIVWPFQPSGQRLN